MGSREGVNVQAEAANALVAVLLLLLLLLRLLLLQHSVPVWCEPGQTPRHLSILPSNHPSSSPSRLHRALLCARPGTGHRAPNPQSTQFESASLPSSCPRRVRLGGGGSLRGKVQKARAQNPGERRSWRRPDLGGPGARASEAARGPPVWRSGGSAAHSAAPAPRALPSPARVEFGCCARGGRGYEGFESAQAAEWSSHLFPPPATGLNFCKFKLNGAFFRCLPEGACSPPRAALGRERLPGAQLGASEPDPSPCGPTGGSGEGGGCQGARAPGPSVPAPGPGIGPRPPPPLPGPRAPCSPEPGDSHQPPGRDSGSRKGPGRPSEEELLGGGPRVPRGPGGRYCLRAALGGGRGRGSRGPGGAGPRAAAGGAGAAGPGGGGAASAGDEPKRRGPRASAMPAAAGDGLLGEPAAPGGGGGAEDAARPAAACEGSFLPAWVSGVPRERLRDFQHHKRVGNYLIGSRKLGEGSFAKVREGLHVLTGEKVAIKVIDKKRAKKDTYVTKNLRREGQIQQMIRHPNITQLLDILETENSYYLVMELCPGGNLMHKIYEKKRLEESEARRYIRQLISAVEHLHRAGVVHRDLKIENLLLDEDNNIKLIDFGLSNCAGILGHSDPFSTQCGSPAYAAPELLARKKYGPKIDVWSIGVNMYAMLTGTLPFTVEPFSLRALYQKMVDKEMNPLPTQLSTGAVNFLRSLLEPDPVKRPNIQQALANRWLNENYMGKVPCNVTYPNRISLEDLSPSVVLHMTEKLGYKNSDVINTVLSNRACHILAIYFLLNKKLERYLSGKSDIQDGVCYKTQLYQIERCRPTKEPYEHQNRNGKGASFFHPDYFSQLINHLARKHMASLDTWTRDLEFHAVQDKKPKEQEKRGDFLHRPFSKKLDKNLPSHKQPSASLITQIQNTRALLKDRKAAKPGFPDKDSFGCRNIFRKTSDSNCVASSSMEFIPVPPPRTPRVIKKPESPQQGPGSTSIPTKEDPLMLDMVRSFESVEREDQTELLSPSHHYRILNSPGVLARGNPGERTLSPVLLPGSPSPLQTPLHSTLVSFAHEDKNSPPKEEGVCSPPPGSSNGGTMQPLGSPHCVKSRGRFPMMGIGQMLRKRHQSLQPPTDRPLEASMPPLQPTAPVSLSFDLADGVKGQC